MRGIIVIAEDRFVERFLMEASCLGYLVTPSKHSLDVRRRAYQYI
jgi:hypothetical protein